MTDRMTDEILIADLEENLADDPYGTATFVIRNTLTRALKSDFMSDAERANLVRLDETLARWDNYHD